jgi:hypothetical protein
LHCFCVIWITFGLRVTSQTHASLIFLARAAEAKGHSQTVPSLARNASLMGYIAGFGLYWFLLSVLMEIITVLMRLNMTRSATAGAVMFVSVMPPMVSFVKKHQRTMFTSERARFAVMAGLLMWLIIGVQYCIYFIASGNPHHIGHHISLFLRELRAHPIGGPVLMAIVAALQFGLLYLAVVFLANKRCASKPARQK